MIVLLEDSTTEIDDVTYKRLSLEDSPGGLRRHHSYSTELLQHVIASTNIALTLCNIIKKIYHEKVDRTVVLATIITHDPMKFLIFTRTEKGKSGTSPLGERIDHLTLIVSELIHQGFPMSVIHAVTAHHGRNSPLPPVLLKR